MILMQRQTVGQTTDGVMTSILELESSLSIPFPFKTQ